MLASIRLITTNRLRRLANINAVIPSYHNIPSIKNNYKIYHKLISTLSVILTSASFAISIFTIAESPLSEAVINAVLPSYHNIPSIKNNYKIYHKLISTSSVILTSASFAIRLFTIAESPLSEAVINAVLPHFQHILNNKITIRYITSRIVPHL
jgi:hypothetical protein